MSETKIERGIRMGKEKSITIEIKEDIYGQLEAIAQKQGF